MVASIKLPSVSCWIHKLYVSVDNDPLRVHVVPGLLTLGAVLPLTRQPGQELATPWDKIKP